jgi:hypothetical protein
MIIGQACLWALSADADGCVPHAGDARQRTLSSLSSSSHPPHPSHVCPAMQDMHSLHPMPRVSTYPRTRPVKREPYSSHEFNSNPTHPSLLQQMHSATSSGCSRHDNCEQPPVQSASFAVGEQQCRRTSQHSAVSTSASRAYINRMAMASAQSAYASDTLGMLTPQQLARPQQGGSRSQALMAATREAMDEDNLQARAALPPCFDLVYSESGKWTTRIGNTGPAGTPLPCAACTGH